MDVALQPRAPEHGLGRHHPKTAAGHGRIALLLGALDFGGITGAVSKLPNTTEIYLLVEKNPTPLAAAFMIPAGTEADVQTRLKMGQSTNVLAVVKAD
ncbi:hypothetical protein H4F44_24045, partial [Escherichia coli]|nr:hypothetical protein [Escherichia coli]